MDAKTVFGDCTVTKQRSDNATLYFLEMHNRPDNRLTPDFISKGLLPALEAVEADWRQSKDGSAALITHGPVDAHKFYSNGLNLPLAWATPLFFPRYLNVLMTRLLQFPIPTIAAVNGHAFAGGFCLALAHDYIVMKDTRAWLSMNEIDFGANIPTGMMAVLKAKLPHDPKTLRRVLLEGQRITGPEALELKIVDGLAATGEEVIKKAEELGKKWAPKAKARAWGLIKAGMWKEAIQDLATDRGSDGMSAPPGAKL